MNTKVANSFTFSRDFVDGAPRIRASDLLKAMDLTSEEFVAAAEESANIFDPRKPPIIVQDGDSWLTESQCYGLLTKPAFDEPSADGAMLPQVIVAFVEERRKAPQPPTVVGGQIGYVLRTPSYDDFFRTVEGQELWREEGAILAALVDACGPGQHHLRGAVSEALAHVVRIYDVGRAVAKSSESGWFEFTMPVEDRLEAADE